MGEGDKGRRGRKGFVGVWVERLMRRGDDVVGKGEKNGRRVRNSRGAHRNESKKHR